MTGPESSSALAFLQSALWPILFAFPAVWALAWWSGRGRARRVERVVGERAPVLSDLSLRGRGVRQALLALGVLLTTLALLQPTWGPPIAAVEQRGVDLVVCLDVSRSMLAADVPPSRLEAASRAVGELARHASGDRLGLIVFAGEARVIAPLTRDAETLAALALQSDPVQVERGGTDLGVALDAALTALAGADGDSAAVVLVTDGEDHGGAGLRAAARCAERGVVVHCVGLGSVRGTKIALPSDGGPTFLADGAGTQVVSALDIAGLRAIAKATGGHFVHAEEPTAALRALYDERIAPLARAAVELRERRERPQRFQWPLAGALLLFVMDIAWTDRK